MKHALLAAITLFVSATMTANSASAAELTKAQNSQLSNAVSKYYVAMFNGDTTATAAMEAPGFTAVTASGKPVDMKALMTRAATVKLSAGQFAHQVKIDSSSINGDTIMATVTLSGQGLQMSGANGNPQTITASGKHALTIVKGPTGAWLVQKDVFLSR